jgi:hypothetical protein
VRTDPTDNGGLFVGRRPGTAPLQYRELPDPGSAGRRRADGVVAGALLVLQVLLNLLFWGPIPAGSLWIASQRLDHAWVLVRRASGVDQREGVLGVVFGVCAVVGGSLFVIWLIFIGGLGSMAVSGQS